MKCTISKGALQAMLVKVLGFTERKSTLPILSHVLLEASSGGLKIKATDLHTSIQVIRDCDLGEAGACAINAKNFLDLVRTLPDELVDIWTNAGKAHIVVVNFNSSLNIMDAEEYPKIEFRDLDSGTHIDPMALKFMIDRTGFSIPGPDEDDTQYTLGGALLVAGANESGDNYIEMVTTDSRRLSVARYDIAESLDMGSGIIVPRKGIGELKRLIEAGDESASILLTKDSIFYVSTDTTATVRLIDGKFPDYRGVVNQASYPIINTMKGAELMSALKVCSAIVSDIANCVKFSFKNNQSVLYAHNPDQGDVETSVNASHSGEELEINFNPRYFIDCLNQVEGEVEIRLKASNGPCLITPANDENCKWVIMPMRF